jgi:FHS family Na+ dependent glucose MFS transporter 1
MEKPMTQTSPLPQASDSGNRLFRVLVYYATFVVLGLITSAIGPTLSGLADVTGSTLGQVSIVFTLIAMGYMGGSLLAGRLYDGGKPSHPLMTVNLLCLAGFLAALPLLPQLWLLGVDSLLVGVTMAVLDVGGNTLTVWVFGDDVGPYMNALHLAFGVGAFLSPMLIDRVIVLTGSFRWSYWLLALLLVPIFFWMLRIPSPARPVEVEHEDSQPKGVASGFAGLTILLSALMFLHVGAEVSFGGWIFSYAVARQIGTETVARLLNSLYWGGFMAGRVIAIPLATRLSPQTMILADLLMAAASVGVILLFPGWPLALWIGVLGFGLSVASLFASTLNFAARRMPITGSVTGYFFVGSSGGSMTLPWLIGQLFEPVGPVVVIYVIGASIVAALVLFTMIRLYSQSYRPEDRALRAS